MRITGRLFQILKVTLLCIAALNTVCWATARLRHELDAHRYAQVSDHAPYGGTTVSHGAAHPHGACNLCELFSHLHPNGTSTDPLSWIPDLPASGFHPGGYLCPDCEPAPDRSTRAPPFIS